VGTGLAITHWRNARPNPINGAIIVTDMCESIVPDDSLAKGTIYIVNNVPKTTSNLPKVPMLSAD
jgi:hypothetical protein